MESRPLDCDAVGLGASEWQRNDGVGAGVQVGAVGGAGSLELRATMAA